MLMPKEVKASVVYSYVKTRHYVPHCRHALEEEETGGQKTCRDGLRLYHIQKGDSQCQNFLHFIKRMGIRSLRE